MTQYEAIHQAIDILLDNLDGEQPPSISIKCLSRGLCVVSAKYKEVENPNPGNPGKITRMVSTSVEVPFERKRK